MFDLASIEAALDSGLLEAQVSSGRWWRLRRNGKTKLWPSRPGEFRLPVKAGFCSTGAITHTNMNSGIWRIKP